MPQMQQRPSQQQQPQQRSAPEREDAGKIDVMMYVWGSDEPSSANALDAANRSGAIDYMNIVDVRDLRVSDIPEWLHGVPTALAVQNQTVYRGTKALQFMQEVVQNPHAYRRNTVPQQPQQQQQQQHQQQHQQQPPPHHQQQPQQQQPQYQMPMQQMEGIGQIPQRQTSMMRGIEEQMSQQPQQQQPPMMENMGDDKKVSANDMAAEIEQILARREQMMNDAAASNAPRAPLPTANSHEG